MEMHYVEALQDLQHYNPSGEMGIFLFTAALPHHQNMPLFHNMNEEISRWSQYPSEPPLENLKP